MKTALRTASGFLAVVLVSGATAIGCGETSGVLEMKCNEISSSGWRNLRHEQPAYATNGELEQYARAIEACGVLEGFGKAETIAWLGRPESMERGAGTWILGSTGFGETIRLEVTWSETDGAELYINS